MDRACPAELDTCRTVHYMTGQSSNYSETVHYFTAGVVKMCSTRTDSSMQAGCRMWEGRRVCSACCGQSYCNEGVPWGVGDVNMFKMNGSERTTGFGVFCYVIRAVMCTMITNL